MNRLIPAILTLAVLAPAAVAQEAVEIREWEVPWTNSRPRDPYPGPDGRVWFVGQTADYVAALDPATGEFQRFELDPGAGPHNLIVAADGGVWYAGNRAAHIGRLDPATGEIRKFPMPDPAARDPHTLMFDPAGDIWFTMQGANMVGKLDVETGDVHLIRIPTADARPYGLLVDPDGRPWFTLFGTNKLGTVDPMTMELEEVALPRPETRARRIERTTDGAIWYVDYAAGYVGRLDPATRQVEEWATPGAAAARPYGMTVDAADRIWFVESGPDPNRFVGFDPATGAFHVPVAIPSGGGTVRHMEYDPEGDVVWFGTDAGTIGRATLP
jgi:virginiamycin B lyase